MNSLGYSKGFLLANPVIFNPIDFFFGALHRVFPLDYIFLGLLVVYMVMCALVGLRGMGVRFLGLKVCVCVFVCARVFSFVLLSAHTLSVGAGPAILLLSTHGEFGVRIYPISRLSADSCAPFLPCPYAHMQTHTSCQLYDIKRGHTGPHGLLLATVSLTLVVVSQCGAAHHCPAIPLLWRA